MSKLLSISLALVMIFSLAACTAKDTGASSSLTKDSELSSPSSSSPSPSPSPSPSQSVQSTPSENDTPPKPDTKPNYANFEEMPAIYIDCENGASITSKEVYVNCNITVTNCSGKYALDDVPAGVRTRGNSTSNNGDPVYALTEQVPYRIKFDKKQSMLGLNDGAKCKSWVLLKPTSNHITAFSLGQSILVDDGYYCSDGQYVEVYVNDEYKGVYILAEQSQINENRVDVFETPEGHTGYDTGYLMEINNYPEGGDINFFTNFGDVLLTDFEGGRLSTRFDVDGEYIHRRCYTLKNDNVSHEQYSFIYTYLSGSFHIAYQAIVQQNYYEFNDDYTDFVLSDTDNARELISRYIDLDSLVDMYLLQEITMNTDVGAGSFYLSADFSSEGNKKLTFECPWDFDWAFVENSRYTGEKYEGFSAGTFCKYPLLGTNSERDRSNPWLILFMNAPWFRGMVYDRLIELKDSGAFDETIDEMYFWLDNYSEEFAKNLERWAGKESELDVKRQIEKNIVWLENRLAWLENALKNIV